MLSRAGSVLAGAPLGVLAALALGAATPLGLGAGVVALCGLWAAAAFAVAARGALDPGEPWARAASAASSGLASLPLVLGVALHLAPGAAAAAIVQLLVSAVAFLLAARGRGSVLPLRSALAWTALGMLAAVGAGVVGAWQDAPPAVPASPARAAAIYALDAQVATLPLPVCGAGATLRVLADTGARPRLDPEGDSLWYDASVDGVRQVHRLDLGSGESRCWTCDEPGHNWRPDPGVFGVVFETDRHADLADPTNTELHLLRRSAEPRPSRRLTRLAGPDGHARWAPGGGLVWARRGAAHRVVRASILTAHGALETTAPVPLATGGVAWTAPLAWSPNARHLLLLRGSPFAPAQASDLDPATGRVRDLTPQAVPGGADFSADGGVLVVAEARRGSPAGWLPAWIAAPLAPLADAAEREVDLFRGTRLLVGAADAAEGALQALSLPETEGWGMPTGVALSRDGTRIYLGQRAPDGAERIVVAERDCR